MISVEGSLLPSEQAVNQFVAQPINNLIVFLAIIALVIVLASVFVVWKFAPMLYSLYKQQADTNKQNAETNKSLTTILENSEKRAEQRTIALQDLGKKTDNQTSEITKQTASIETSINEQRTFSMLVTRDLSVHAESISGLAVTVKEMITTLAGLEKKIDILIQDRAECLQLKKDLEDFQNKFFEKLKEQAKRATDSQPIVVPVAPATPALPASAPSTETMGLN